LSKTKLTGQNAQLVLVLFLTLVTQGKT